MTIATPSNFESTLGENHGYRFEGDFVHLNAEVSFSDADLATGQSWALQLWAGDGFESNKLTGVKVAELPVQAMAGGLATAGWCAAMPPAGAHDQALALALVAFAADGTPQLRDLAVYPCRQNFFQPSLVGEVNCTLAAGTASLSIDQITNPRSPDNLSGTLTLEVWALDASYAGGGWTGSPVATVILGVLAGGDSWSACRFDVPAAAIPENAAALTVMLREWTSAGYVTRDYRNFPAPTLAAAKKAGESKAKAPAAKKAAPKAAAKKEKVTEKVSSKTEGKVADPKKAPLVSINKASEDELAAVKGISRALAKAVIAGRPYASLDDVSRAKGMGPKTLKTLKDFLSIY